MKIILSKQPVCKHTNLGFPFTKVLPFVLHDDYCFTLLLHEKWLMWEKKRENSYIVYSSTMKKDKLVTLAHKCGSADMNQNIALHLKDKIMEAFQQADDLPSHDFLCQGDVLPSNLERFLNFLLAGKADNYSAKVQRMVSSLGQVICRAVTVENAKTCTDLRYIEISILE